MVHHGKWVGFLKITTTFMSLLLCMLVFRARPRYILDRSTKEDTGNYFNPPSKDPVALRLSSSTHYELKDTTMSAAEFSALLPAGGQTVHVDNTHGEPEVYTVTLFHQMKCLDIMRTYYVTEKPVSKPLTPAIRHCLNYLKQTILCRPSLGLESIQAPDGHAVRSYEAVCHDWSAIYAEASRNQEYYLKNHD